MADPAATRKKPLPHGAGSSDRIAALPSGPLRPAGASRTLARAKVALAVALLVAMILAIIAPTFYGAPLVVAEAAPLERELATPVALRVQNPLELSRLRREERQRRPHIYRLELRGGDRAAAALGVLDDARQLATAAPPADAPPDADAARVARLRADAAARHGVELSPAAAAFALAHHADEALRSFLAARLVEFHDKRGVAANRSSLEIAARDRTAFLLVDPGQPLDEAGRIDLARARQMVDFPDRLAVLRTLAAEARLAQPATAVAEFATPFLVVNVLPDEARAARELTARLAAIDPPLRTWRAGDVLLPAGHVVGPEEMLLVDAANAAIRRHNVLRFAFFSGLLVAMVAFMAFYIRKFQPEVPRNALGVVLAGSPIVIPLLLGRLLLFFFGQESGAAYAFPAALVGMLSVILVEARFALLMVVGASLLFGFATGIGSEQSFATMIVSVAGGFGAVMSLFVLRRRRDILVAGLQAGVVSAVSVLGVEILGGDAQPVAAIAGFAGGLASGLLTYPILDLLERVTGITTDVGLMELTSIRHPLLEQLEEKAPGTYQHTLNVTKLAEAAAVAVGANYLLIRAGCMFHDIGKMDKPKYFSENQVSPEDRKAHDKLTPQMSALIIKEHVRNGVLKAREYNLPRRVIDFIPEHHGTTTIAYFYHKALKQYEESESNDPVRQDLFQYGGPPPQTRETAIALLADSVDAVAAAKLSGATVSRDEIKRIVRDVINQKFREEQFDECSLTLRDLSKIQDAFIRALEARYHHRVKYPEPPPKRRAQQSADEARQRAGSKPSGEFAAPAFPRREEDSIRGAGTASAGSTSGPSTKRKPA